MFYSERATQVLASVSKMYLPSAATVIVSVHTLVEMLIPIQRTHNRLLFDKSAHIAHTPIDLLVGIDACFSLSSSCALSSPLYMRNQSILYALAAL